MAMRCVEDRSAIVSTESFCLLPTKRACQLRGGIMAKSRFFVSQRYSQNDPLPSNARPMNHPPEGFGFGGDRPMSRLMAVVAVSAVVIASMTSTGCCFVGSGRASDYIHEFMERQVACMRDHVWAKRAFHLRYGRCERPHATHFRDGFVCGYSDVCGGGEGIAPTLPPEKYWSYRYRSNEGSQMQNAWFEGYEAGSSAARQDGITSFNTVQISRDVQMAMQAAEQIKLQNSGIEKSYIVDVTPVESINSPLPQSTNSLIPRMAPGANQPTGPTMDPTAPLHVIPADVPVIQGQSSRQGN